MRMASGMYHLCSAAITTSQSRWLVFLTTLLYLICCGYNIGNGIGFKLKLDRVVINTLGFRYSKKASLFR